MPTSEEIITKTKTNFGKYLTFDNIKVFLLVALVIVVGFLVYHSIGNKVDMTKLNNIQTQNEKLSADLATSVKDINDKITNMKGQLATSDITVKKLKDQLAQKETDYAKIKEPKSRTETLTRLHVFAPSAH